MRGHQFAVMKQPDLSAPQKTSASLGHASELTAINMYYQEPRLNSLNQFLVLPLYLIPSLCVYRQVRSDLEVIQDILKKVSSGIKNMIKDSGDELT